MVRSIKQLTGFILLSVSTLLGTFCATPAYAQVTTIEASVDKNPVIVDESFVLTVTFNDDVDSSAFQPQQLLSDFIVGRTSVSRQTSIVNGDLSKLTRFTTVLIARQQGDYTIPAIMMDGAQSQPITVEVLPAGSDTSSRSDKIAFIESTLDSQSVFLQQPFTYIVRLYLAADLNKGNLMPPKMEHADIRQIGSDEESTKMLNGRRYKVYQRTYQITPNKSGEFDIEGARFDGEVYAEGQRSIFSSFSNTQPVSTIGKTVSVQVKPVPANWQGHWLPSELVTISQSLTPEKSSIDVGEPITLSYQLTAVGVKPEQLPAIQPQFPDSVRVYPDNEKTDQFVRNGVTIAQKTMSYAVVPNEPGSLQLPAFEIPWFNTKRGQRDIARTDAVNLAVNGVVNKLNDTDSQAEPEPKTETPAKDDQAGSAQNQKDTLRESAGQRVIGVLAALLVISLLGNLAWFWRRKKRQPTEVPNRRSAEKPLTANQQWRNFQKACADNHARKADEFLRKWAQQRFNKRLVALGDLARWVAQGNQVDDELKQQLNQLQQSLFSASKPKWTGGKTLYQSLRRALEKEPKLKRDELPRLY